MMPNNKKARDAWRRVRTEAAMLSNQLLKLPAADPVRQQMQRQHEALVVRIRQAKAELTTSK